MQILARNHSAANQYIQSITLNGRPLNQVWVRHADLVNGATQELHMGSTPNKKLGADPASFPPSIINTDPQAFTTPTAN